MQICLTEIFLNNNHSDSTVTRLTQKGSITDPHAER